MKTKNLYIASIGIIFKKDYETVNVKKEMSLFIAVKKTKTGYVDVLTGKRYLKFSECSYADLEEKVGDYIIRHLIPIERYISNCRTKISTEILLQLLNELNGVEDKEEKNNAISETFESITDVFLKLILKTKSEIEQKRLSEVTKKKAIQTISELGIYYLEKLKEYTGPLSEFKNYRYSLRGECIKTLVDIEFHVEECEHSGFDKEQIEEELKNFTKKFSNPQ